MRSACATLPFACVISFIHPKQTRRSNRIMDTRSKSNKRKQTDSKDSKKEKASPNRPRLVRKDTMGKTAAEGEEFLKSQGHTAHNGTTDTFAFVVGVGVGGDVITDFLVEETVETRGKKQTREVID